MVSPYDMGAYGGVQNQVLLLSEALGSLGHQVTIVGPGQLRTKGRFVSLGPSRVVRANDSNAPISLRPNVIPRLRRAVALADVVHVHEPLMPLIGVAARWTGKPLIGTFHADPSPFVRSVYRRFPPLRWHLRSFASLVAVSETAHSAVGAFGDIRIVPNGVQTDSIPSRQRVPGRVLFVGRNDERKGLDIALAAIRLVRQVHPDVELVVVSPDEVAASDHVTVHRGIGDAAKLDLLASAEVFIAPNRRGESFGLTVAEAMAAGCVVVASDLKAFRDVVGDAGVFVPVGEADSFAGAIMRLLDDGSRLATLATAAAIRATMYSIETTAAAYSEMYVAAVGAV